MSSASMASAERLAAELLSLKKDSGLSFARLSERTHYAKSSWERWVNGKQFPPRAAVESIARLCETDPEPFLDLWDRADEERLTPAAESSTESSTETPADGHADVAETIPRPLWRRPVFWAPAALALTLAFGAVALAFAAGTFGEAKPQAAARPVETAGPATGCTGKACEGKDPKKMNCGADAVTVRTGTIPKDLVIELRYSRACEAAWGRISFAEVGATVVINNSDGAAAADVVHYDRDVYSPLIAAPDKGSVWVCAALPKDGPHSCTGRFIPSQEER
ncbi:DUF2690 domain-containing protein [Streptomyces lutosisoli]|uniref:DUF2690 domain-containing protein n=1 Tax=Streptomyces lutosisoli TaxID=2665721 RepID=A0ABW2VB87_9ACTN